VSPVCGQVLSTGSLHSDNRDLAAALIDLLPFTGTGKEGKEEEQEEEGGSRALGGGRKGWSWLGPSSS
jgi:hypothetical protein